MTQTEYQNLAKQCASFQSMPIDVQNQILAAQGAEMESYIQMFSEESAQMNQATQEFQSESDKIILDFKKAKTTQLKNAETQSRAEEEKLLQNFLNNN